MFLYLFRVFTIIHYQIANLLKNNINFANWLSNLEFTIKSRPHYGFTIFTRIQSEFTIFCKFTLNSLSFLRIHYKFSNFIANQLWIYSIFRKFTIFYAIEVIPYESNVNNARIPVVFCEFIMNSFWSVNSLSITLINHEFTMNWLSFSGNHYKSTIFFANTLWIHFLWIHYLFRASTMIPFLFRELSIKRIKLSREYSRNSLSISRTHFKFSIISREFNMNSVSAPRIYYQFRDYTLNSPSVSCIHYFSSKSMHSFYPLYPD